MASKDQHFLYLLPADRPRLTRLLAFVLGTATTLVFAPVGWGYLAPLLVLPLLFVSLTVSPKDAGSHFFWYGLGLFLTGTYWIYTSVHVFGSAPLWVAVFLMVGLASIMATFLRLAGWLTCRVAQGEPWLLLLVGPSAWVLIEWLRGWVLTGFPWLALGYSQLDSWLAGWAPVFGVYGVSLMLMLSAAALLVAILTAGWQRGLALAVVALPWFSGGLLQGVEWTEAYGEPIRTSIVQAGVGQDRKWLPEQRSRSMDFYRRATLQLADSDLVVWPEVAVPAVQDQVPEYLRQVAGDARRNKQTVLLGILERRFDESEDGRIFNSVMAVGAGDVQYYRKRHLVPFGEYFPVPASVRRWMRMQNLPHADLAPGAAIQPLLQTASGLRLALAICYEDAYPAEQLYAFPEADLIVNVSNDAWFGETIAPHQHLQIAQMRALEFGRYAVRSTNNGISAFIRPDGSLLRVGEQFREVVMTADLRAYRGATPFSGVGNWPAVGSSLLLLAGIWIRGRIGA